MDLPYKRIDKYEIIEEIGRGGMAVVYKGLHPFLDRYVAIKVLPRHFAVDKEFIERFKREAKITISLVHPNIVKVYDAEMWKDIYYIVMQYVEGTTVKELIEEERKHNGIIDIDKSIDIIKQISSALSYAHKRGVIHRDIKPSNILIESESGTAYIADFGIAKAVSETKRLTVTGASIGTPEYMSPEQFKGEAVDSRSDIYSLGTVFYEMLTGRIAFEGDTPLGVAYKQVHSAPKNPRIYNPKIHPSLEKIVQKMMAKDKEKRYQSCDELINDIILLEEKQYDKISANSFEEELEEEEGKGFITIRSVPPDAKAYIDGTYIGNTPTEKKEVSAGRHTIFLIKVGYETFIKEVNIENNKEEKLEIELKNTQEVSNAENIIIPNENIEENKETSKKEVGKETSERPTVKEKSIEEPETVLKKPLSKGGTMVSGKGNPAMSERSTIVSKNVSERITRPINTKDIKKKRSKLIPVLSIFAIAAILVGVAIGMKGTKKNNQQAALNNAQPSYISISSTPTGASVYINDVYRGKTPLKEIERSTGNYKITLKKDGYKDSVKNISITDDDLGKQKEINIVLEKKTESNTAANTDSGTLLIKSNPANARIFMDGKDTGEETPYTFNTISIGKHSITLKKDGYQNGSKDINVEVGKTVSVLFTMQKIKNETPDNTNKDTSSKVKEYGNVTVSSYPDKASIYIDGKYTGKITTATISNLLVGNHKLMLKKKGYRNAYLDINIVKNYTKRVSLTLYKEKQSNISASIYISSSPEGAIVYVDGNVHGVTPLTVYNLSPGKHKISLSKYGMETTPQYVTLYSNKLSSVKLTLKKSVQNAFVTVKSTPSGALVYIDGKVAGLTPVYGYKLSPGVHGIKVQKAGYETWTDSLILSSGESKDIDVTLEP